MTYTQAEAVKVLRDLAYEADSDSYYFRVLSDFADRIERAEYVKPTPDSITQFEPYLHLPWPE